jgi:hypothetical protein
VQKSLFVGVLGGFFSNGRWCFGGGCFLYFDGAKIFRVFPFSEGAHEDFSFWFVPALGGCLEAFFKGNGKLFCCVCGFFFLPRFWAVFNDVFVGVFGGALKVFFVFSSCFLFD